MPNILIRDVPDKVAHILTAKASQDGLDRQGWIRALLIRIAAEPIVKMRYAIHFSTTDNSGAQGQIRRFGDDLNDTHLSSIGLTSQEQVDATEMAKNLIRRNEIGDREEAIHVLKRHFNNVFEMPV